MKGSRLLILAGVVAGLLADDTTGRGHLTRSVGENSLLLGVVPIE